jgi:hypothetical protein
MPEWSGSGEALLGLLMATFSQCIYLAGRERVSSRVRGVAQVVEHLPHKCKALSPNPVLPKKEEASSLVFVLVKALTSSSQGSTLIASSSPNYLLDTPYSNASWELGLQL